ncbi:hypothetical protein [Alicyclobacillus herbarius]|uniref:hypothetical protein n=1 Tax=Alicyclobacillus herbarius TaxID=122960 RepID=UPI0004219B50|nr:hypothetical protein [Alicyclobacillus herbarius]
MASEAIKESEDYVEKAAQLAGRFHEDAAERDKVGGTPKKQNAALDITSRIFEVMGARSTASRYGFDRFWRNVRTHTLHNPAEFKLRNVGNWFVNRKWPEPGYYS